MDNGQIDVGFGLDTSQASVELQRLKAQLDGISTNLLQSQRTIERRTQSMVQNLTRAMGDIERGTAGYNRKVQDLESQFGRAMSQAGRGGMTGQQRDAAARSIIADARNAADQVTARLTNELVNQFSHKLRAMDGMVAARMQAEAYRASRFQAQNSAEMIAARQILDQRRAADTMFEAQNGRAALQQRNTMDRFNANGGANIMAIQSRVLANFTALSMAFNSLRNTAGFIVELDKEFHQFQAITATTSAEMVGLKERLISVSEQSKFTALEVAQAATIMGQAGLSAKEVADSVGAVAMLATASGTSLAEAVDVVTSTMSVFNLQTSQAADVANTLTSALNLSKLTIDKVALGLQYSGNIAADVGLTYQELTAALAAMANSGIRSGSTLGTGLRQLLIDIQNPTAKFTKILGDLGLTQEDVSIESNGLINVLNTLKAAGFGTAEAFEVFQVRAAAAYGALANNTELASELQQQFTLTTAATQANDIQMQSLSNTYAKWQSVFGTVAYRAFEPFVRMLRDVVDASANAFSVLNKYPALLQVIGALTAGLVTAASLSLFSALIRGVLAGIPAFSGFAVATGTATGALGALFTMVRAHPLLLLIGGLTTAVSLIYSFSSGSADAAEKVDLLKAQVNGLRGEIDEANNEISAIEQTISNLIKQKTALDRDPLMRQAKILEVKQQFTELSSEVDTTTGTVEQLIDALQRLATTDLGELKEKIGELIAGEDALIAGYESKFVEDAEIGRRTLLLGQRNNVMSATNLTEDQVYEMDRAYRSGDGQYLEILSDQLLKVFDNEFGEKIAKAAAIAVGRAEIGDDPSQASGLLAAVGAEQKNATAMLERLRNADRLGALTDEARVQMNNLPRQIEMLTALQQVLAPLVQTTLNIAQSENTIASLKRQQAVATVEADPAFQQLNTSATNLRSDITERMQSIGRNSTGKTSEELLSEYKALEEEFKARVETLKTGTEALKGKFPDLDPALVENATRELLNTVASLTYRISSKVDGTGEVVAKLQKEIYEDDIATIDREIASAMRTASQSNDQAEIATIETFISEKYAEKAALLDKIYDADVAIKGKDADTDDMMSAHRRAKRQMQLDEQDRLQDLAADRVDAQVRDLDAMKAATDEEIRVHRAKIKEVIDAIKKSRPGAAMDQLIAQYNELAGAMSGLQSQSSVLGIQSGALSSTGNINLGGSKADKANAAMQYYISVGYSQAQAAGIVGNLLTESSLDPTVKGDGGKAFGIAQWHPDRQALLDKYVADFGGNRNDYMTQVKFVDHELRNYEKSAYNDLKKQVTAGGAADSFRRNYERPHHDPSIGHHARRIQYANALVNGGYSTGAQAGVGLDNDFNDAVATATTNAQRTSTNTQVKSSNQLVSQLMAQAKGLADPQAVKNIIASVDAEFAKVIEARTTLFNQENASELAAGNPDILAQRDTMLEGVRAEQQTKVAALLDEYYAAASKKIEEPLLEAQAALAAAQAPGMEGKFTGDQLAQLQGNANMAEREVQIQRAIIAEQALMQVQQQRAAVEAQFGSNSSEATFWMNEEIRAKERLVELTREKNALEAASAQAAPNMVASVNAATNAWAVQNGMMRQSMNGMYEMVPLAEQVGNAWGGVLDGLTSGFTTLFTDLVSGTMTAEEAFKKFALSVIQMFIQMIAKALAMQLVMGMTQGFGGGGGMGGGGGGLFSNLLGGLFGVPGMANGGGVRGAATGELITGGVPNRDSVLRKLMPGELVLRKSAVSAIGEDKLNELNNLGNRTLSNGITPMANNDQQQGGGIVNVWVVTPDQQPSQMGPGDIIATVSDNIMRRGSLKTLIKQVQMGAV